MFLGFHSCNYTAARLISYWICYPADNLNGAQILGRIIRVDHVSNYKKKEEEEDEETERQKREARGVCRAFQRGECNRGAGCKFSHDEQVCFEVPMHRRPFFFYYLYFCCFNCISTTFTNVCNGFIMSIHE